MAYEFNSDLNIGEYWISSNKDKNFENNYTQTFNIFGFEIPIVNEFPGLEIENVPSTMEKSGKPLERNFDIISRKRKLFKTTSRGRKSKIGQTKIHTKSAKDNILRKVNVRFLIFVIELANIIVTYFGFKGKFIDLDQNFKTNITK